MSTQVCINHLTHYHYDRPVILGPHVVRLRPTPHSRTSVLSYSLNIAPEKHFINWQQDPQGNWLARLVYPEAVRELRIEVDLRVEMAVINPFDFFLEPYAEKFPFEYPRELTAELAPYRTKLPASPRFAKLLKGVSRATVPTVDFLIGLNQLVAGEVRYLVRLEPGVQTPEETLELACGSCRDSGWLLVQLFRHLGLAARFVSGYLVQLTPDVKAIDGPVGTDVDFTDLHAWCEVYLPGAGWVGLDATSGLLTGEGHIPLAATPDPSSASPVSGSTGECEVTFTHAMRVDRVLETPRVTKPYTEDAWQRIETLGDRVDTALVADDVRLTMGGEPTFVSASNRDGREWNTDADSPPGKPEKRRLGAELLATLKAHYAPHGLPHYGQGKWYPGEPLPRWSLSCFWRKDGEPVWTDAALIADEAVDYGATEAQAQLFLQTLAPKLGLVTKHIFPAYEDVWYYLWRERQLAVNVDPLDARLSDPLERARLRKVFDEGLEKVAGHVLPMARTEKGKARWKTGSWFLRAERCYLVPGDSPLGLRLPLDSQPWAKDTDYPWIHAADPTQDLPPLPTAKAKTKTKASPLPTHLSAAEAAGAKPAARTDATPEAVERAPKAKESAGWVTRSALCIEPRHGVLYVFMPPLEALEDYLELIAAIEASASELGFPVVIEGYEPPYDPRMTVLRVTPDPGVLEINIQPAKDWKGLIEQTTFLYDTARAAGLSTEKFMLDGRHTGTGGGNHFVMGGDTPKDSPFLRRPDLLASMVATWHNHPSLSYLFSGLFVGPTSQAPRMDEARNDSVYEMEIAFRELARLAEAGKTPPPWRIDRALRNLLIDSSGNTHRSEFCIDKLYSPDGPTGRLGLLEMRGFEMPPHARMSLIQQLLLRAMISRFWRAPYQPARLKRWGTELHDRFMLPYFVWQDFCDVIEEMNAAGWAFEADWFLPHLEFRFPRIGSFEVLGAQVELRAALEPWHVMGESGTAGGTVRYVDSSLERLQLKATGLVGDRHVLTCNGRTVPLAPTGNVGEFVGGVRYKAWAPPNALHPTIGVHAPLVFDLVDTWMGRSMGGCQYHVTHPGGRAHDTNPVNAYEAEGRRLARFFRTGHTPGPIEIREEARNPGYPFTLDLRR